MISTRIKICGLREPAHVAQCAALGVDAIGLVFVPKSVRAVDLARARELAQAAGPLMSVVGLFLNATEQTVEEVLQHVALDQLQFHGNESAAFCESFARPYIKALSGSVARAQAPEFSQSRAILIDSHAPGAMGGSGHTLDWAATRQQWGEEASRLILAGGLNPDNVAAAIRTLAPAAVDVSSGVERERGVKDADKIVAFVDAVRRVNT